MNKNVMIFLLTGTLGFFAGAAFREQRLPFFTPNRRSRRRRKR
jgi:hypothetical protein